MSTIELEIPSATQTFGLSSLEMIELRNRNVMSAMTRDRPAPGTMPNDANVEDHVQRAEGPTGLIPMVGILTSPQGTTLPEVPGLWSKKQVEGWKRVTDADHATGRKGFARLWHVKSPQCYRGSSFKYYRLTVVGRMADNDLPEQKKSGKPVPVLQPSPHVGVNATMFGMVCQLKLATPWYAETSFGGVVSVKTCCFPGNLLLLRVLEQ